MPIVVGDVETLAVEPAALELLVGQVERFDAIASVAESPDPMDTLSWCRRVDWTSSDDAVVSVDDDGDVTCS